MNAKKTWSILKATINEFSEDNVLRLSAALSYYSMFSIGPLLVIAVGVAGLVFGHQQIQQQLQSMLGPNVAKTLGTMMLGQKYGTSLIATITGLVALLFGAGGVFGQLQDALNTIWEVKAKPGLGIWGLIHARFLSLAMVLGTGFLLLVSMALTTFLSAVSGWLGSILPIPEALVHILNFIVSFGVISLLFAMIFKYLPDVKVPFRKVWVGAIGTALLFTIGKYLLAFYLGRTSTTSSLAASVIIIMMWVYYASVILFFGAEFTQVYAKETAARVVPTKYAAPVTAEARAEQGIPHQEEIPNEAETPRRPAPGKRREPVLQPVGQSSTPGAVLRERPMEFLSLMLMVGFAGGILVRFKSLRKALRWYAAVRHGK